MPPSRVIKCSWLDPTKALHELQMYTAAHRDGKWLLGLARHEESSRICDAPASKTNELNARPRFPEVTSLLSFGEPLSECRTPRELFEVIYDVCLSESLFYHKTWSY